MTLYRFESEAVEHLGYEWWMFQSTWATLSNISSQPDFVRNALLESLVIHARAMIDFYFYGDAGHNPKQDDWTVDHLGHGLSRRPIPPDVAEWRTDVNKRVAHMTARRESSLTVWKVEMVAKHLRAELENTKRALGNDFPTDWLGNAAKTSSLLKPLANSGTSSAAILGPTGPS